MNLTFVLTNKNNEKTQISLPLSEMPETDKFSITENYDYVSCVYSTSILDNTFIKEMESYILTNEIEKVQILSDTYEILTMEKPSLINTFISISKETINKNLEITKNKI